MKTIGLVTYFKSYNYGAWLQAYATEKFLQNNGFNIEIIDYENYFESRKIKYCYKEGDRYLGYLSSFFKSLLFGKVRYYNKGFKRHISDYYRLSDKNYSDVSEMNKISYDILAVGSDQVWNPKITNGLDDVFMLKFGIAQKKISIASSLGSKELRSEDKKILIDALQEFSAISVREEFAKDFLQPHFNQKIKVLVDPTFLLNKEQWIKLSKKSKFVKTKERFILTYFVSKDKNSERCLEIVRSYSKKFDLPIWAIQFSSFFSKGVDRKILGASIADFIALMLKANLIITDSFHGIALSLNLNKNFVSCINTENPIRTQNLLLKMQLSDRINMDIKHYKEIDYLEVNQLIEKYRQDSQKWLLEELNK